MLSGEKTGGCLGHRGLYQPLSVSTRYLVSLTSAWKLAQVQKFSDPWDALVYLGKIQIPDSHLLRVQLKTAGGAWGNYELTHNHFIIN